MGSKWVAAVVSACVFVGLIPSADAVTAKSALLYGDSIAFESRFAYTAQLGAKAGWTARSHAFPGFSPCDWVPWVADDLALYHPTVVLVETAGNNTRPCMLDSSGNVLPRGSDELHAKFDADLDAIAALVTASGARLVFVQAPPMKDAAWNADVTALRTIMLAVAGRYHRVSFSGAPRNAVSNSGKYTDTKPCLSTETAAQGCDPITRRIAVRTIVGLQAGIHLCPDGLGAGWPYACLSDYSSGEFRFGKTLANVAANPPKPILP